MGFISAFADRKSEVLSNFIFFLSGVIFFVVLSSGDMPYIWAAIITIFLLGVMYAGNQLARKVFHILPSSSSTSSSSDNDIPDYWNWDTIYRTKTTFYDEGEITKEKAIEQFQRDYEKTMRAFSEEEKLRAVSDYDKNYIEMFFRDFESVIDTNLTALRLLGDGKFSLVQQVGGATRTYTHWPRRRHSYYDFVMWQGEIKESETNYIRYGLSNQTNIQYWETLDGNDRTGFTPMRGEI